MIEDCRILRKVQLRTDHCVDGKYWGGLPKEVATVNVTA